MTTEQKYKWATVILAIVVVILAIVIIARPAPSATDALGDAQKSLSECRDGLLAWNSKYATSTPPLSAEAQQELDAALKNCQTQTSQAGAAIQ